jgi:hypothetical protein
MPENLFHPVVGRAFLAHWRLKEILHEAFTIAQCRWNSPARTKAIESTAYVYAEDLRLALVETDLLAHWRLKESRLALQHTCHLVGTALLASQRLKDPRREMIRPANQWLQ